MQASPPPVLDKMTSSSPLARIQVAVPLSIIVPTYRERENIPLLIDRIDRLRRSEGIDLELIFMDDNSRDGSADYVREYNQNWVRLIERTGERGLAPAVIDGFRRAGNPVLICMDCDLSHPAEQIPQMVLALASGQEFALGSRYVPGASTDDDWGFFRWLNSRIATWLARPLTSVRDPMSGFFAMRKSDFDRVGTFNPVGYKVALELIVKCDIENVAEVPIHFANRIHGDSKLTFREQLKYIQHLRRLYLYKFANAMHLLQFLIVGASGVVVNMLVLTLLMAAGLPARAAIAGGIIVSVLTNFLLNRRFTFSYARDRNPWKQLAGFIGASAIGMAVNYGVSVSLLDRVLPEARGSVYLASLCGILAGMTFNFLGSRYVVFRKRYIRKG